jgi:hypothetical protein
MPSLVTQPQPCIVTLPKREAHSTDPSPTPPLRAVPRGSTQRRGSSLVSQSSVRATTIATPLSFQKTLVHMPAIIATGRAGQAGRPTVGAP